jgi:hypothetical protein
MIYHIDKSRVFGDNPDRGESSLITRVDVDLKC